MNYYEELGLTPRASTDEIRRAYRQLARMLHPDLSEDDSSRPAAEAQMKRLNEIAAVLTDPESRQRYDRGLERCRRLPAWRIDVPRPGRGAWIWILAGVLGSAALVWFLVASQPSSQEAPPPIPQARAENPPPEPLPYIVPPEKRWRPDAAPVASAAPDSTLQRELEALPQDKTDRPRALAAIPESASAPAAIAPEEVPQSLNTDAARRLEERGPKPAEPLFAGTWLYAPEPAEAPGMYPPEYIELTILEDGPTMRGRYKAKYRVTNRTISPSVNFEFEVPAQPGDGEIVWHGPGGARGRVKLKLKDAHSLEMDWWATQLGSEMGLTAGRAVLVRLREP